MLALLGTENTFNLLFKQSLEQETIDSLAFNRVIEKPVQPHSQDKFKTKISLFKNEKKLTLDLNLMKTGTSGLYLLADPFQYQLSDVMSIAEVIRVVELKKKVKF